MSFHWVSMFVNIKMIEEYTAKGKGKVLVLREPSVTQASLGVPVVSQANGNHHLDGSSFLPLGFLIHGQQPTPCLGIQLWPGPRDPGALLYAPPRPCTVSPVTCLAIPATPDFFPKADNVVLWLDINWKCIFCPSVITLPYGSIIQSEALLYCRMKFCIIFFSSNAQMEIIFWSELGRKAQLSLVSVVLFSPELKNPSGCPTSLTLPPLHSAFCMQMNLINFHRLKSPHPAWCLPLVGAALMEMHEAFFFSLMSVQYTHVDKNLCFYLVGRGKGSQIKVKVPTLSRLADD